MSRRHYLNKTINKSLYLPLANAALVSRVRGGLFRDLKPHIPYVSLTSSPLVADWNSYS